MRYDTTTLWLTITLATAFVACGDGDLGDEPAPADPGATSGSGAGGSSSTSSGSGSPSGTTGSGAGSSSSSGSGGGSSSSGSGAGPSGGMPELGALIVLGDSISDGGGEAPFYYDLLVEQLEAFYGHEIVYENHAAAGSTTMALAGQVGGLPAELTGPVAVAITSGGNNMQYNILQILAGADQNARDRMAEHIDGALAELLAADRFGAGVTVQVFEANIYDPSDGLGNFGSSGCTMPIDAPDGSAGFFSDWNGTLTTAVAAHGQTVVDFFGHFSGHGFNGAENWFFSDCIHPNAMGHAEIAGLFYRNITGQP